MRIVERHFRSRYLCTIVGAILLLFPCRPINAVEMSPPTIESMALAELNRIITQSSGSHVLFFTAAWCGHCKAMLPDLNRLHRRFHNQGIRFVGLSVDAGGSAAFQEVVRENRVDFPVFWVGEGAINAYRLLGIPMIFLIKDGQLVEKIPGKCSYTLLEEKLLDLIK